MKKIALFVPALALSLAACGEEPAPEPAPVQTPEPAPEPSLPAPDQELFSGLLAEACPELKPVNTAVCKRAGFGSSDVICEYGLGEDSYLRNKATLTPGDGEWTLADPASICAPGAE
ncbi:MSCRAMM family adhesin [Pelagerythrobacter marinus]|uniref:Lipoprotein n=1 Tax=Pelagerythrobacter marinus TaxID=538382 RepID=A0ABW9UYS6_9SPHN|nr:hypothetical protein [Pelagerythrobacter marinus]MEC9066093.1 hypothetical protein [Pseudomonadota bacterium]MXO69111.1 hypothetical protein [Pelagerythrobacter marinus]USA40036.1 hypothetical protein NCF86_02435 [Pelagerythrobacter marinus]WPZ05843.1 hypothetical protein T8T98_10440 [Pelagerythrobacter marinus]